VKASRKTNFRWEIGTVLLIAVAICAEQARTQNAAPNQEVKSELAQQNSSFVAASAAQIKAVLVEDAGLMVAVKQFVANEATSQGQMIDENDLTDEAIFQRLESDVPFRSNVTKLVQQYGYLQPKLNPDSPIGKQQELLIQERVKWLAQQEEEDRAAQRQEDKQRQLAAQACSEQMAQTASNCALQQTQQSTQRASGNPQTTPSQNGEPMSNPGAPVYSTPQQQNTPANPGTYGLQLQLASLQMDGQTDDSGLAMLGLAPSSIGAVGQGALGQASLGQGLGGLSIGSQGNSRLSGAGGIDGNSLSSLSSLLGANGTSLLGSGAADSYDQYTGGLDTMSPAHPSGSFVVPNQGHGYERRLPEDKGEQPRLVRANNPYQDIPSLYDMYLQATPQPAELKRFGGTVFENGVRDPQLIPMDMPAGPDYVVGPGDGLSIDLWGGVSERLTRTVDREGRVSLPEVGPVLVSGKSLADVQEELQRTLRTQYKDESADVSLSRLRTIRIYEVGDVLSPGAYDISSLSTPLNALFAAGGPTTQGSMRLVKHYRGSQLIGEVDLYDLLLNGVRSNNAPLENGDTVLVPPIGPQVTVEGMVRRPAIYELKDEKSLASVLELSGGLLPAATLQHIEVQRLVAHQKQTMLSLDIPASDTDADATKQLDAFQVQDGDRIRVFPIAPYNQDAVYLEGHVLRPGKYSYHENMRVTDLFASYKDLLPEPSTTYGEIIRLNPPDFHPTVESFNLADAIQNPANAPVLAPMDTVRIFGRYDFENAPAVSVWGDVRNPGTYPTSGQIHLSDAVHLAGGVGPDAESEDAQVFRYLPDGSSKIFSVNLAAALAGSSTENILLDSRDRLLIHRSPEAVQPAIVYVEGDVTRPGRYPLTTNMTVAELIHVGGGLRPSADRQTADLTHYNYDGTDPNALTAQRESISINSALSGDAKADIPVHNGDVLTVRELPGWNDLGASITVKGEVKHPGTYGIRPGEKLSSIIERAGGYESDAYPYGSVLQRMAVRELETKAQADLMERIKNEESSLAAMPESDARTKQEKEMALAQYQTTLTQLEANPPEGRVDIRISDRVDRWRNTSADVEVRAGDSLTIPKKPSYVMVTGQVFNATAVSYRPGRSAKWYLSQSGGPTTLANRKAIFVIRADGSVIGGKGSLLSGDPLDAALRPGDAVVVPEKAIGGGPNWQNLFTSAQIASSIASTMFIALRY
jgi:protein involved in polysaccharide export with SLBB domain